MNKSNILILDDEETVQSALTILLEKNGYSCFLASDTKEARDQLDRQMIDLLLCDVRIPGESGIDFLKSMGNDMGDTAVIMVTGEDSPREMDRSIESGIYGYLLKPFETSQILVCVANALRRRELEIKERAYHEILENEVKKQTVLLTNTIQRLKTSEREAELSRKKTQRELDFLQKIINFIPNPIYYKDLNGNYQGCNGAFEKYIGLTSSEIIGRSIYEIAPKDLADASNKIDRALLNSPGKRSHETLLRYADGSNREVILSKATYTDNTGCLAGLVGVIQDVTEQKKAERQLRESEEKFRAISESAKVAIIIMNDSGQIAYWNKSSEKIFGYSTEEASGKELHRFVVPPRFYEDFSNAFEKFKKNGLVNISDVPLELTALRRNGEEFPVALSLSSIRIRGKWNAVGLVRDMSDKKKLENNLLAEKKNVFRMPA